MTHKLVILNIVMKSSIIKVVISNYSPKVNSVMFE